MAVVPSYVKPVSGQYLAHAKLTKAERAFLAADLVHGTRCLTAPTVGQAAVLTHVSASYVYSAFNRAANRNLIESGCLPLVPPPALALPRPAEISDAELIGVVRRAGAERTFKAIEAVL